GLGEAGAFPGIARVFSRWLPADGRGRAFGVTVMTGALGGAITQPLVVALLRVMSWRQAFPIFGAVGVVWALVWFWWFRDDPRDHRGVNRAELEIIAAGPPAPAERPPWTQFARDGSLIALS